MLFIIVVRDGYADIVVFSQTKLTSEATYTIRDEFSHIFLSEIPVELVTRDINIPVLKSLMKK
jgi:hypothetical protein